MIQVSPTEPAIFKREFHPSPLPEQFGVDFIFATKEQGMVGVQRKTLDDLLFSVRDGRMATQRQKAMGLKIRVLLLEGAIFATNDGFVLTDSHHDITLSSLTKMLLTIQLKGYWLLHTDNERETITAINALFDWSQKANHSSLDQRPGAERDPWGETSDELQAIHFLSGLPGIGRGTAKAIYDMHGKPLIWTISYDDLRDVPGVGKKRAESLMEFLDGDIY